MDIKCVGLHKVRTLNLSLLSSDMYSTCRLCSPVQRHQLFAGMSASSASGPFKLQQHVFSTYRHLYVTPRVVTVYTTIVCT